MRVKSIVVDGFKSYAHRKELDHLSPHFNAITGLNGSGKSNIFDAICFVMGITNLKRVRAEDPRELIFRAGTTGVHAARVTIEFENNDPSSAPPGYSCEDYPVITIGRQIKMGGKQQFFFNGTVSMQSKVKRFFESISLNVDNPHFMVLQGTVHKMIGMKPQEILSLVEEAVGTKTFDHRRRSAEALIRNKDKKLQEIDNNIEHQIGPMLEAMRADQEEYEQYLKMTKGLEDKRRFKVAFEYYERMVRISQMEERVAKIKQEAAQAKESLLVIPQQEDEITRRLMVLQEGLSAPSEASAALYEEEAELKKTQVRHKSQMDECKKQIRSLEQTLTRLQSEKQAQKKQCEDMERRKKGRQDLLQRIKDEKENVSNIKQAMQLQNSGVRAGASGLSLEEERSKIARESIHCLAEITRSKERIHELDQQLQQSEHRKSEQAEQIGNLKREIDKTEKYFRGLEKKYKTVAPLVEESRRLHEEINGMKEKYLRMYENHQKNNKGRNFDLEYNKSESKRNLDENILGRVGELIYPIEERHVLALTAGAQSQLTRVVVLDDVTAEELIRCGLRNRTSFIAINKLQTPRSMSDKLEAAKRIATSMGGFVWLANELTKWDSDLSNLKDVNNFVFGGFFVCSSVEIAQELAYNKDIKCKAVSLDGEVVEPNGLMTGGSTQTVQNLFIEFQQYRENKAPLKKLQTEIRAAEMRQNEVRFQLQGHGDLIKEYQEAEEELALLGQRLVLAESNSGSLTDQLQGTMKLEKETVESLEKKLKDLKCREEEISQEASMDLGKAKQELQKKLSNAQKMLNQLIKEDEVGAAEFERLEADTEQQALDLESKLKDAEDEIARQRQEVEIVMEKLKEISTNITDTEKRRSQAEEQRERIEKEIEEAQEELQRLGEKKGNLDNIAKNSDVDLKELINSIADQKRRNREDERVHTWLEEEKGLIGSPNGPYCFDDKEKTQDTLRLLREIEMQAEIISKRMNKKATVLYEDRKKEYDVLVKQRIDLCEDKKAIECCILDIEEKKWLALDRMVKLVNTIFGKLFSTCLPGASAELQEDRDELKHLTALRVKVIFNGKEKESLSELSGGQRSLLALCLILAILRVRPAPIYILDEVDAALDPSHTQNIGQMLQIHFPKSQFLLVSLKDGMFNNADVLYHIRNTQGYSEVTRIETRQAAPTAVVGF